LIRYPDNHAPDGGRVLDAFHAGDQVLDSPKGSSGINVGIVHRVDDIMGLRKLRSCVGQVVLARGPAEKTRNRLAMTMSLGQIS
jgi:hypothetical protein